MIYPIGYYGFPSFAWYWNPFLYRPIDSFSLLNRPYLYPFAPTNYLSLYWRLTDAAINAEFWANLQRSLSDSYSRILGTASRPAALV